MTDEETRGLVGLGKQLLMGLPAQFLALMLVNVVLVGGLFWHLDSQLESRERVLMKMVETCGRP